MLGCVHSLHRFINTCNRGTNNYTKKCRSPEAHGRLGIAAMMCVCVNDNFAAITLGDLRPRSPPCFPERQFQLDWFCET